MPCRSCGSLNQGTLTAEMAIDFPGLKNIGKPVVWVFPEIVVCLDCGTAEFAVPESELRLLVFFLAGPVAYLLGVVLRANAAGLLRACGRRRNCASS